MRAQMSGARRELLQRVFTLSPHAVAAGDNRARRATAMHLARSVSRPPGAPDFRHTTLVARAFRSRPLCKAKSHVHDRPVALRAHREAASLEHIQHGDIFREYLGDELTKSSFTAEGCEMAHQS
jgi:hypothetical protein